MSYSVWLGQFTGWSWNFHKWKFLVHLCFATTQRPEGETYEEDIWAAVEDQFYQMLQFLSSTWQVLQFGAWNWGQKREVLILLVWGYVQAESACQRQLRKWWIFAGWMPRWSGKRNREQFFSVKCMNKIISMAFSYRKANILCRGTNASVTAAGFFD